MPTRKVERPFAGAASAWGDEQVGPSSLLGAAVSVPNQLDCLPIGFEPAIFDGHCK